MTCRIHSLWDVPPSLRGQSDLHNSTANEVLLGQDVKEE